MSKQKLKFLLVIKSDPLSPGTNTAYQIACALMSTQQTLLGVFFHQAGVYAAETHQHFPSDEPNILNLWKQLYQKYHTDLWVCQSASEKRGVTVADYFKISKLSQLVELSEQADRVLNF